MTWDYYVHTADEVRTLIDRYNSELSNYEQQLRNARDQQRREIRNAIQKIKDQLRSDLQADIIDPASQKLAARLIDDLSLWWLCELPRKEDAREAYISIAQTVQINEPGKLSGDLNFRPDFTSLPTTSYIALQVDFELLTPWYSKDDRVFHVLDNPVRKDRVFGVPFMSAASWKGMLRWACRMQAGLQKHLEEGKRFEAWKDPPWILHLFGNEKGEERDFHQGALIFYPTWFDRIGFEVINPHSRERRAGTQPIYYEVVPGRRPKQQERGQQEDDQQHQKNQDQFEEGGKGALHLLYAPWPGMKSVADPQEFIPKLLKAIENLLTTYGISAKRTVGWGTAEIQKWRAFRKGQEPVSSDSKDDLWKKIQGWFQGGPP
ncbi:hypothetical protein HRbin18_02020 [bacterium HR18]|nr:hypothetical protein HRbin18_02020 [bacterium HR18]